MQELTSVSRIPVFPDVDMEELLSTIDTKLSQMDPISLEQMSGIKLMNRIDTKYLVDVRRLPALLDKAKEFVEYPDWIKNLPLLYVWGHSYEFVNDDNWCVIESFAEKISNKEDIWYATNMEIYNYIEAYNMLTFSLDGSIVSNPTATELWFHANGETICVKPGETKKIR